LAGSALGGLAGALVGRGIPNERALTCGPTIRAASCWSWPAGSPGPSSGLEVSSHTRTTSRSTCTSRRRRRHDRLNPPIRGDLYGPRAPLPRGEPPPPHPPAPAFGLRCRGLDDRCPIPLERLTVPLSGAAFQPISSPDRGLCFTL